jgi:hypothetical protein
MLKKLLKGCLTIAMVSALAIPAMADSGFNGRVRGSVVQTSVKDGGSVLNFESDARLGGHVSGEAGSYTATGYVELEIDYRDDSATHRTNVRDLRVELANDSMSIRLGRQYPYGIAKGMAWAYGNIYNSYWAGESVNNARADYLKVGLKEVGLTAILGMNNYNSSDDPTGDQYQETTFGVVFSKGFGALSLAVEYTSQSRAIDTEYGDGAVEKSANDGYALANMALAVGFSLNEQMGLAFNYDSKATTEGTDGAEEVKATSMEFWFDLGLDDTMGVSIGYGTGSEDTGDDNPTTTTMTNLTFSKNMGAAVLYASYIANTEKDDDDGTDAGDSTIGGGIHIGF